MKIIYTKHALENFEKLPVGSVKVKQKDVLGAINRPDYTDLETDKPKIIVHGSLDQKHIVRVVYKKVGGIITVITFYPTRRGRYEK